MESGMMGSGMMGSGMMGSGMESGMKRLWIGLWPL